MNIEEKFSDLVLVRHGQSEWNAKNLFTGWKDPSLTEKGLEEAKSTGKKIKEQNIMFDIHFTSELKSCLLYTSPSPRDRTRSRMPSSA